MSILKEEAESLGIKVDDRWSDDRIQAEIDKALGDGGNGSDAEATDETPEEAPEPEKKAEPKQASSGNLTVRNPNRCGYRIETARIRQGEQYTLTDDQLKNERLMRKTKHAIKTGVLDQV